MNIIIVLAIAMCLKKSNVHHEKVYIVLKGVQPFNIKVNCLQNIISLVLTLNVYSFGRNGDFNTSSVACPSRNCYHLWQKKNNYESCKDKRILM